MTHPRGENPQSDELTHYGVKGMRWGVRKARTGDLNVRASRLERVASGKGSLVDKAVTLGGSTAFNLARSRGLKNEAARRAKNYRGQIERLSTGKAKVTDILKAYGTVSVYSLAAAANKKTDYER
jgi:hypothetical protein